VIGAGEAPAGVGVVAKRARGMPATAAASTAPNVRTLDRDPVLEIALSRICRFFLPRTPSESLARRW